MDISLAYEIENNKYLMRTFNKSENKPSRIIDRTDSNDEAIEELNELSNVNLLFSDQDHSDIFSFPTEIASPTRLHISREVAENMVYDDVKNLLSKIKDENTIKSNLNLTVNMTKEGERLSNIFKENREIFILNLWKVFYKNISCSNLSLLFQTIDSKDAKSLTCKKLQSSELESVETASDEEKMLFNDLNAEFGSPLNVSSYAEKSGQLVLTSTLKTTKIIMMANVHNFSLLQQSCLKGLMNSVNHFIK